MRGQAIRGQAIRALALACALACAFAAQAVGTEEEGEGLDPEYASGKRALEAKDWPAAIRFLNSAALRDTRNADLQNFLGYAYRNSGELALAFRHYNRALQINARHRGAHEYLGEAYLMSGNLAKAEEHLALLGGICLIPCPEQGMLREKIAAFRAKQR
jgi:Flp pilus assembly protein TadD